MGKKSSSSDDNGIELKSRRSRRWGDQLSQASSAVNADGNGDGNDFEVNREHVGISAGLVGPSDGLAWGKSGRRSHTRHGSMAGGNGTQTRYSSLVGFGSRSQTRFSSLAVGNGSHTPCGSPGVGNGNHTPCSSPGVGNGSHTPYSSPGVGTGNRTPYSSPVVGKGSPSSLVSGNCKNDKSRCARLADYLCNLVEKDEELDVNLMLIPVDEERIPHLQQPYLCCRPTLSIKSLCQYVALETALQANEIEIYMVKESHGEVKTSSPKASKPVVIDTSQDKLQILKEEETLAELKAPKLQHGHVLLAYQKK